MSSAEELLELARRALRREAARRREAERATERLGAALDLVCLELVDTVEHLEKLAEAFGPEGGELAEALRSAVRQALERLDDAGVRLDGAEGELFDPERHRAVDVGGGPAEGTVHRVTEVLARGVTCRGRRLRPAEVVVRREREERRENAGE